MLLNYITCRLVAQFVELEDCHSFMLTCKGFHIALSDLIREKQKEHWIPKIIKHPFLRYYPLIINTNIHEYERDKLVYAYFCTYETFRNAFMNSYERNTLNTCVQTLKHVKQYTSDEYYILAGCIVGSNNLQRFDINNILYSFRQRNTLFIRCYNIKLVLSDIITKLQASNCNIWTNNQINIISVSEQVNILDASKYTPPPNNDTPRPIHSKIDVSPW